MIRSFFNPHTKGGFEEMMSYVWTAVIVGALLLESVTMGLISIWFVPGALVALVMSLCHVAMHWQIIVFAAVSLVMLLFGMFLFRPRFKKRKKSLNTVVGRVALITEAVNNVEGRGAAKLGGQIWTARSKDDEETLLPGDQVVVVAVEGVKLICRKK
jgi:membrane protein implicated in regulation of membrane protease activity